MKEAKKDIRKFNLKIVEQSLIIILNQNYFILGLIRVWINLSGILVGSTL